MEDFHQHSSQMNTRNTFLVRKKRKNILEHNIAIICSLHTHGILLLTTASKVSDSSKIEFASYVAISGHQILIIF